MMVLRTAETCSRVCVKGVRVRIPASGYGNTRFGVILNFGLSTCVPFATQVLRCDDKNLLEYHEKLSRDTM